MDDRIRKVILVLCVADVVLIGALAFILLNPAMSGRGPEVVDTQDVSPEGRQEKIRILSQRIAELEQANARLEQELGEARASVPDAGQAGGADSPSGRIEETTAGGAKGASQPGSGPNRIEATKPTWDSLAAKLVALAALAPGEGERPTPGLMKAVSELMAEVSALQADLKLDDPGFVTESPAFKARLLRKAMEQSGTPMALATAAELDRIADDATGQFLEDARLKSGDFALERTMRVLKASQSFEDSMSRFVTRDDLARIPLFKDSRERDTSDESTSWPSQSSAGVKDLGEAADHISRNWMGKMGIPEQGSQAARAIAFDFVQRSQAAKDRAAAGGGELSPQARRELDMEIAGYQVEALRRLRDSFGQDPDIADKISNYDSLDRFAVGESGSWMRKGSFGGFVVKSSADKD